MTKVMTTKMSSKGQVVLPEALRQMYGWDSGTAFTIIAYKGSILMQPLRTPTDDEIAAEFEEAFAEARRQAEVAGMTPMDIANAVSDVRLKRRAESATT